uniref:DUF6531 domain-containing protein n=1 Tax=Streptomyces sp. YIM 98790 TaxID=2689077 RepID=UPI00140AD219
RDLEEASDAGMQNKKWWQKAVDWVVDNWDTIVNVCKIIVAVLGIVVMIIGGPLAWVVLAAALIVLADTLIKYANGKASLWDVAFAALDCIPGFKGLTTAAGLLKGAKGLMSAAKTGIKGYASNLRNLRTMFQGEGIKGALKCLIGDPIDIATGEMTLRNTDVELPGVLPLLIEREHLSDYRHGHWFGRSWTSTFDQRLVLADDEVALYTDDGMRLHYPVPIPDPDPQAAVLPVEGPRWPLSWDGTPGGAMTIHQPETGRTLHFVPVPGRSNGDLPLAAITDRNSNRIDFHYNDAGEPTEVVHSGGYRIGVAVYDDRVTSLRLLSDPAEPVLRAYDYDDAGNLAKVYNSSGLPLLFEYDTDHRMVRWEDRNGTWYRYAYDPAGRCVFTTGTERVLEYRYTYEPEHNRTTATDSLGHATVYQMNDRFQLIAVTDPLGHTSRREWDPYHRLLSETDPLGRRTEYEYDENGNLTLLTRPDGSVIRAEHNESGLPTQITQPDGTVWSFGYDSAGNRTTVLDPAGNRSSYAYEPNGALSRVTTPLGNQALIRCNAAGLPIEATDPLGAVTVVDRDAFGRPVRITDSLGHATTCAWTTEGRLARRTDPQGAVETFEWDPEGNLLTHVDESGGVTSYTYGPFDLPLTHTGPDGVTHTFARDTALNLVQVTNPLGHTWTYTYDPVGRLIRESDFDGRATTYLRDAAGQLTSRTNAAGQTVAYTYNALGQLAGKTTSDGDTTSYTYDPMGRVVHATSPGVVLTRSYDMLGNLVTETVNGRTLSFSHDPLGQLTRRRTPGGHTSVWEHDPAGRVASLTTDDHVLTFTRDATGQEIRRDISDTLALTQRWDPAGRLTHQALTSIGPASRTVTARSYTYRPDWALTGLTDHHSGTHTFSLDAGGRVISAVTPYGAEKYTYDPVGNQSTGHWPAAAQDAVGDRSYTGTLLTRAGSVHYAHDPAGRVTLRRRTRLSRKPDTWRYIWNAQDQLIRTVTPDGTVWTYTYDPFGRRVSKQRHADDGEAVEQTTFVWHDTTLVEQTTTAPDSSGAVTLTWNHDGLHPLAQTERTLGEDQNETDRRFYAIVTDLVGTPTHLSTDSGEIVWRQHTTVWGNPTHREATTHTPLRFPGQYADDETGWHYNYFRHYDPATGRYSTLDPLGLAPAPNPQTYVHNPHTWVDPFGLAGHANRTNYMNPGETFADYHRNAPRLDGYHDVVIHGTPNSVTPGGTSRHWDHRELANRLRRDPTYGGGDIRLVACSTGSPNGSFAQDLANQLGVNVLAPHDKVWIWDNGAMRVGDSARSAARTSPSDGWSLFAPGGGRRG